MAFLSGILKARKEAVRLQHKLDRLVERQKKWRERIAKVPPNATIREEYVKCGKTNCKKLHGPYYYAYWKANGLLKKIYIGNEVTDGLRKRVKIRI